MPLSLKASSHAKSYHSSHNFVITNIKKQKHRLLSQSKKQRLPLTLDLFIVKANYKKVCFTVGTTVGEGIK